jgi:hypothetical protein
MRQFTLDLRRAGNLNPNLLTFRPVTAAPRQPLNVTAKSALTSALALGKGLDPKLSLMSEVTTLGSTPGVTTVLRPAATPSFAVSRSTQLTMAVGFGAAGFAIFGSVASIGVYASTTREIGGYLTLGIGLFLPGVGASVGGEFTIILGTPFDLSGPYLSAGVSVAPAVFGIGAALLFSPGPPLTLMGLTVSLSANTPSELPLVIALEATDTKIKPFVRF